MKDGWIGRSKAARIAAQIAFGILALAALAYDALLLTVAIGKLHGNDFGKFYYAAQQWLAGRSLYAPTVATRMEVSPSQWIEFTNMNPPHFHLAVLPFTLLPLDQAAYLWTGANLWAGILAAFLACQELDIRVRRDQLLPLIAAILTCAATAAVAATGQFTGALLLGMALAWREARHRHPICSGVIVGLLISLKPFLALFVPVQVIRRDFSAAAAAVASFVVTFALGIAVFGLQAHREWLATLTNVDWAWGAMNASWLAVVTRSLEVSPYYNPIVVAHELVRPIWLIGSLAVVAMTISIARQSLDHAYAGIILGGAADLTARMGLLPLVGVTAVSRALEERRCSQRRQDRPRLSCNTIICSSRVSAQPVGHVDHRVDIYLGDSVPIPGGNEDAEEYGYARS